MNPVGSFEAFYVSFLVFLGKSMHSEFGKIEHHLRLVDKITHLGLSHNNSPICTKYVNSTKKNNDVVNYVFVDTINT